MKTKGKDKSAQVQEEALIKKIADCLTQRDQNAYTIGKYTDELIDLKGGIKYGAGTIERIAKHRTIDCSSKQLRRYWAYYRLFSLYGKDIEKVAKNMPASYRYELARLLDLEKSEAEIKKLVIQYAQLYADYKSQGQPLNVDTYRERIRLAIDEVDGGQYKPKAKPSPKDDDDKDAPDNEDDDIKPDKRELITKLLSFDDGGLEMVADYIVNYTDQEHLGKSKPNIVKLRCQAKRLEDGWLAMANYLVDNGDAESLGEMVDGFISKLQALLKKVGRASIKAA